MPVPPANVDFSVAERIGAAPTGSVGKDGSDAAEKAEFWVKTDKLRQFVAQLTGGYSFDGETYTRPYEHPDIAGLYVSKVSWEPDDDTNARVKVTVEYAPRTFGSAADSTLLEETIESTTEFLTLPAEGLYYGSDGSTARPVNPAQVPQLALVVPTYSVQRYRVRDVPEAFLQLSGACNKNPVRSPSLGLTFAPETLLAGPVRLHAAITMNGPKAMDLSVSLRYKPSGWNRLLDPDTLNSPEGPQYVAVSRFIAEQSRNGRDATGRVEPVRFAWPVDFKPVLGF